MIDEIIREIKKRLKEQAPVLTQAQKSRRYVIHNSTNPKFETYGHKLSDIEKIIKSIFGNYECSYEEAAEIFKRSITSNNLEEQFAGVFFLNRFKKEFNAQTIDLFHDAFYERCDTWALCDSSCIRVLGPFLAKNSKLAEKTIENWSNDENLWIRRASMVIVLKLIMLKKDFNEKYVFDLVEKMLKKEYPEDYIQKGIGWLLKTASKVKPEVIFNYLTKNKTVLPRLVLRYGSEKLPEEKRSQILKK